MDLYYKNISDADAGRRWFTTVMIVKIITAAIYIFMHIGSYCHWYKAGNVRIEFINKEQIVFINDLIDNCDSPDSLQLIDSRASVVCDSTRKNVITLLTSCYPDLEQERKQQLINIINTTSFKQLKKLLPVYPLKLTSYFWLYGNWLYVEIIFWCLFGVLANMLYNVSESLRTDQFNKKDIFPQIAKFFYSPFCVTIVYICYNEIRSTGQEYNLKYSVYSIAIAFLLGFFSGRMIDLLNRLKDLLLPLGRTINEPATNNVVEPDLNVPIEIIQEAILAKTSDWKNNYPDIIAITPGKKHFDASHADINCLLFRVTKKEATQATTNIPAIISYTGKNNKSYNIPTKVEEVS